MQSAALIGLWGLWLSSSVMASPIVETTDRLEINWAAHRIRFYGQGDVRTIDGSEGYKGAEKRAWQDGLAFVNGAVKDLYQRTHLGSDVDAKALGDLAGEAAHGVVTSTSSVKTVYASDGGVRVYLENSLAKALAPKGLRFRQKEINQGTMSQHTGLVLQFDKPMKPRVTYQVVDESGNILFGPQDMAEEAFRKNLMGRWYRKPSSTELAEAVGKNPIAIQATLAPSGQIVVPREAWDKAMEGHKSLLINGAIALALP